LFLLYFDQINEEFFQKHKKNNDSKPTEICIILLIENTETEDWHCCEGNWLPGWVAHYSDIFDCWTVLLTNQNRN